MAVPFLSDVLGGTPETYQQAGIERGTATSSSTTTGTTSEASRGGLSDDDRDAAEADSECARADVREPHPLGTL